jgi:fused signal recognition particle receptor
MFRKIAFISVVLALLVSLTGSFVQLSGAELVCPDWPSCFGQAFISDNADFKSNAGLAFPNYAVDIDKIRKVMGHRYLTAALTCMVLVLTLLSVWQHQFRITALTVTTSLLLILGGQAFLNVWLIKLHAMPIMVTAHFLLSMLIVWQLHWLYLRANPDLISSTARTGPFLFSRFTMLVLFLQIVLGVWVSTNEAGLACKGFPTCNGQWWPQADFQSALDLFYGLFSGYSGVVSFDAQVAALWLHRIAGFVSFVFLTLLMLKATSASNSKPVRRAGVMLSVLVCIQVGLSLIGVTWGMPLWLTLAHHACSVLLMLPLINISFYSRYGYADVRRPVVELQPKPEILEEDIPVSVPGFVPPPVSIPPYVEPQPASLLSRLKLQLKRTRSGLGGILASLPFGEKEINEDLLEEIEASLIMADVGVDTTNAIINHLTQQLERHQLRDGLALSITLKQELLSILKPCNVPLQIPDQNKPFVILVVGVNGAGKTTTIGKLAKRLQSQGRSVMLAAGDTFRAAAVEQLQVWGERNNIHVVAQHTGADSASVIYDGVQSAQAKGIDVLIADTAGRLHTKSNLMDELKKVKRIMSKLDETAPHEVLLVLDAGTGQNALSQTKLFNETVKLTGLVLTKLDGTAKGGVIFALAKQTGIPIRFIGIGEGIDDLQDFNAENFVDALFVKD